MNQFCLLSQNIPGFSYFCFITRINDRLDGRTTWDASRSGSVMKDLVWIVVNFLVVKWL